MKLNSIKDVVDYQQCCGCGACVWARPKTYSMVDVEEHGLRPTLQPGVDESPEDAAALSVCPGLGLEHRPEDFPAEALESLLPGWGPVLEVLEGYATDPEIRFGASSGGAATALALFLQEQRSAHGVLHIRAQPDRPHLNETVLSTDREQVLQALGSRYSPASPCDGLGMVEAGPSPSVFIGKPCDVAATQLACRKSPELDEKVMLTIGIFCAGTPSTAGTRKMLERMGISDPTKLTELRYRGQGWPGDAVARVGDDGDEGRMTYKESWGAILSGHQQWRCRVCADHTGEFADVSVGDPWYREIPEGEPGRSLILVRTERGRRAIQGAIEAGYLECEQVDPELLPASQPSLLRSRGLVAARTAILRALGMPAPKYRGFTLWRYWFSDLNALEKVRSITSTFKRVLLRGLYKRLPS